MSKRLHAMFFHAHPDDESSKGAGTMAKLVQEGHRVSVVTFTDGAAGEILNPHMKDPARALNDLRAVRKGEIANALGILGITEHYDLDFKDSGWCEAYDRTKTDELASDCFVNQPFETIMNLVVPIIRTTRPDVVVTYDERGGYPHPDHIHTHDMSMAAIQLAADPTFMPGIGTPWEVRKIYYHIHFTYRRMSSLMEACEDEAIREGITMRMARFWDKPPVDEVIHASVNIKEQLKASWDALKAHETQVDPQGSWFVIPDDLIARVYPYEEYLRAKPVFTQGDRTEGSLMEGLS